MKPLRLTVVEGEFSVWRCDADAPLPEAGADGFLSVTRTESELSIVSPSSETPTGATAETGWRCLRVEGPLSFKLTGVLAALSAPLARAEVPIFVISTYDTDYLFVKAAVLDRACAALREDGHEVEFPSR